MVSHIPQSPKSSRARRISPRNSARVAGCLCWRKPSVGPIVGSGLVKRVALETVVMLAAAAADLVLALSAASFTAFDLLSYDSCGSFS